MTSGEDAFSPAKAGLVVLREHLSFSEAENTCKSDKRVWMLGLDDHHLKMVVIRPACMSWDCPACAKVLAKRWIIRTLLMIEESDDPQGFDFVTLTLHEDLKTQAATVAVFKDAWRKLYAAMKRTQKEFSYVLVPELHKDNRMHVHIVTNFHPPDKYHIHHKPKQNKQVKRAKSDELMDRYWKDAPRAYGFGYANDQEHIKGDTSKVAGYIAKYLAKQRKVNKWAKGFKHIRASHDVPDVPENEHELDGYLWGMLPTYDQLQLSVSHAIENGYRFLDHKSGEILF